MSNVQKRRKYNCILFLQCNAVSDVADIKENASKQQKANEEIMAETQKVLGELRWALNVKKHVKDAE